MKRLAPLLLAVLALAGCGGGDGDDEAPVQAEAGNAIVELDNVLGLASDFRADEGKTRVLLLFSPT